MGNFKCNNNNCQNISTLAIVFYSYGNYMKSCFFCASHIDDANNAIWARKVYFLQIMMMIKKGCMRVNLYNSNIQYRIGLAIHGLLFFILYLIQTHVSYMTCRKTNLCFDWPKSICEIF